MIHFDFNLSNRVTRSVLWVTLFFILFLRSLAVEAQEYYFDQYSVKEGLSQSKVYDVVQDEQGYLWLGTESGISRFDGNKFVNYTIDKGIGEKAVRSIYIDRKGSIWFGHKAGTITYYNGKTFQVHPLSNVLNSDVTSVIEDKHQQFWVSTSGDGVIRLETPYQMDTSKLNYKQFKGKEIGDRAFGSYIDKDSTLFFITDAMIKKYNYEKENFVKFHPEGLTSYFQITSMMEDSRGDLWFGTYHGGIFRYFAQEDSFKIYDSKRDGIANNWISCIKEDSKGNVWVGTWGGGISRFSGKGIKTFNTSNGLNDNKIWAIEEDMEGNILIGTNEHGLLIFKGEQFVTYNDEISSNPGIIDPHVYAIYEDQKGHYWFGTNNGITIYNPDGEEGKKVRYINNENNMIGDQIRFIKEDRDGNIWIATNDNGVTQYFPETNDFFFNPVLNRPFRKGWITEVKIDQNNYLWIGTIEGIFCYDIDARKVKDYFSQKDGIAGNSITALYIDDKERIWVGSEYKGITIIDDKIFKQIDTEDKISPTDIIQDNTGKIWIGSRSKGVYTYETDSLVQKYSQNNGLLSDHITLLNIDDDNNLFIGTNQGLNMISQPDGEIRTYTKKNGFTGIETKDNATYKDHKGNFWFGTIKGAIKYKPEYKGKLISEPQTHIESMLVNMEKTPMVQDKKFNYTENSISFNFNSISLTNPDAIKYKIKLEGADKKWKPFTNQTTANYSSLSPGVYTFKVKAQNYAGIWNTEPATYHFVIKPPFYQTWWFILGVIVIGIVIIVVYIKLRERNLKKEKQILEQKVAERTIEIRNKNEELEKKNNDILDSIRYAKRIQVAVLPPDIPFEDMFLIFRPKDIVSGDFYWFESVDNKELMAAVDCTGHGVPGAFLSIMGHNLLTKIVKEYGIMRPDLILNKLNHEIMMALHQSNVHGEMVVNDGMDMALMCYDRNTNTLEFSGAYNSLYLYRGKELEEYKANRFPIGRTAGIENKKFTNYKIEVNKGETAYIFSDGYADQFGGEQGKKFKSRPLKNFLASIQDLNMHQQKDALEKNFDEWKKDYNQVDDVVFIGKRF